MTITFKDSAAHFANSDDQSLAAFVANTSDLALIVDPAGCVQDVAGKRELLVSIDATKWQGKLLKDIFPSAFAKKLLNAIQECTRSPRDRESTFAHKTATGTDVKIKYRAVQAEFCGNAMLLGQDVSQILSLQERVFELHRQMGNKLESQNQVEAQYRTLFAIGSEPILISDAKSGSIIDINTAALKLLDVDFDTMSGKSLSKLFAKTEQARIKKLLADVRKSKTASSIKAALATGKRLCLTATPSWGKSDVILIQLDQAIQADAYSPDNQSLLELIRAASEGIVLVDENGTISWANEAFVDLTMSGNVQATKGQNLKAYFERTEFEFDMILKNLLNHQRVKMWPTSLRKTTGEVIDVELSAFTIPNAASPQIGFFIRNLSLRISTTPQVAKKAFDVGSIKDQLGKQPMRELIRGEIEVVEKNLILAALELTGNNRAATAKVLGMSRQSLYQKLSRYGLEES